MVMLCFFSYSNLSSTSCNPEIKNNNQVTSSQIVLLTLKSRGKHLQKLIDQYAFLFSKLLLFLVSVFVKCFKLRKLTSTQKQWDSINLLVNCLKICLKRIFLLQTLNTSHSWAKEIAVEPICMWKTLEKNMGESVWNSVC